MANRGGNFDDDEGFFESLINRKDKVPMPDSMAKMFKVIAGLIVVTIIGVIAWAVWPDGNNHTADTVPVVRADTENYKVEPEDRGGMPIPNKDSTIFEAMDDAPPVEKRVESLLEDEEQPLKKAEVFTPETAPETADETVSQPLDAKVAEVVSQPEIITTEKPKEKVIEAKKQDVISKLKEEAGTQKQESVKENSLKKGNVYIQLASVKTDADAKTKWAKLKSSYPVLQSLSLRVQKADLGAKGTFYRVQAGGLSSEAAVSTCAKVKASGGDCLVVK